MLADGSIALDRVEAASIRFPALEVVKVNLFCALRDSKGHRRPPRADPPKLCTFTFVTKLVLGNKDITVVPDAIGALTDLKYLDLGDNKIAVLPASVGRLARRRLCTQEEHPHGCPRINRKLQTCTIPPSTCPCRASHRRLPPIKWGCPDPWPGAREGRRER